MSPLPPNLSEVAIRLIREELISSSRSFALRTVLLSLLPSLSRYSGFETLLLYGGVSTEVGLARGV